MTQWDVYANPSARSREELPYLIDIQSALLSDLGTRLVVPLSRHAQAPAGLPTRMTPLFTIGPQTLRLVPQEAGAIDATLLRRPLVSLRAEAHRIVDALDAVVSGV